MSRPEDHQEIVPYDDATEAKLQSMLARLRQNHEAKYGPGSFEQTLQKGKLMMNKSAHELTPEARALLESPPPARQS
jgi:hypothetical protein